MIEQQLERRVMDAIEALGIEGLAVRGVWQNAAEGELKNEEGNEDAIVSVAVGGRTFEAFSSCKVDLPVAVALVVREDTDATGTRFLNCAGALTDLFQSWHFGTFDMEAFTAALAFDGFNPFAVVSLSGGTPSRAEKGLWSITFNFTVRGTLTH